MVAARLRSHVSGEELERELGFRIRALRVAARLTQLELAESANVSVGALQHLESGAGATTGTLTKVLRALGRERWIDALGPTPDAFNPLRALEAREQQTATRGTRVRHRRPATP